MQATHDEGSHRWISRAGSEEVVIDLTPRRTDRPTFDYGTGRLMGFTNVGYNKPPPKRRGGGDESAVNACSRS